jgi:hypothetical protein
VAKEPAKRLPKPERSDEYERFEQAVKRVLTVPKKDLDEAVERERQERNGNGSQK